MLVPWLCLGDFNMIFDPSEKRGGQDFSLSQSVRLFCDFTSRARLFDLGFTGPRFTWCNNRSEEARVWSRIDRCLANGDWISLFPDALVKHLPRSGSDHAPLLLNLFILLVEIFLPSVLFVLNSFG